MTLDQTHENGGLTGDVLEKQQGDISLAAQLDEVSALKTHENSCSLKNKRTPTRPTLPGRVKKEHCPCLASLTSCLL